MLRAYGGRDFRQSSWGVNANCPIFSATTPQSSIASGVGGERGIRRAAGRGVGVGPGEGSAPAPGGTPTKGRPSARGISARPIRAEVVDRESAPCRAHKQKTRAEARVLRMPAGDRVSDGGGRLGSGDDTQPASGNHGVGTVAIVWRIRLAIA